MSIYHIIFNKCKVFGFNFHKLLTNRWRFIAFTNDIDKVKKLRIKADKLLNSDRKKRIILGSYIYIVGEIILALILIYKTFKSG
jgi:hypothetical protein